MPATSDNQFVDTNILIYAHDGSAGEKHQRAEKLIQQLWNSECGCLSMQIFQEFYVTITTKIKQPFSSDRAYEIISLLSNWKIHSPEPKDILSAIQIHQRYNISFWDAMIVNSATKLGCAVLWSEDLNDGQLYEGIKVVNPFSEQAAS